MGGYSNGENSKEKCYKWLGTYLRPRKGGGQNNLFFLGGGGGGGRSLST